MAALIITSLSFKYLKICTLHIKLTVNALKRYTLKFLVIIYSLHVVPNRIFFCGKKQKKIF